MTERTEGLRLELLAMCHATALEAFERENRAFFATRIGDRGDDFFDRFNALLADRVEENETGQSLLGVVVDRAENIVARINLTDVDDGELSELGYRVAESAQGRGVATWGVTQLLHLAADRGVRVVNSRVATTNPASQRVLEACGFAQVGAAPPPDGSPKSFLAYRKTL